MFKIRKAIVFDASEISDVSVITWKDTYYSLIDQLYLDNLAVTDDVVNKWKSRILNMKEKNTIIFVATESDKIVAFLWGGKARVPNVDNIGFEIYALYVLPQFQRNSIGKKLFMRFKNKIKDNFFVWVLLGNRSEYFYIKQKCIKTKIINLITIGDKQYQEIAYLYKNSY